MCPDWKKIIIKRRWGSMLQAPVIAYGHRYYIVFLYPYPFLDLCICFPLLVSFLSIRFARNSLCISSFLNATSFCCECPRRERERERERRMFKKRSFSSYYTQYISPLIFNSKYCTFMIVLEWYIILCHIEDAWIRLNAHLLHIV